MNTTFISIHDLSPEACILYSSDSVIDILGYTPDELVNRSCWDFFSKDELPYAQQFHQRRVTMDKAAVLAYCRVRSKSGDWVGCECCFTVVYDVMVVCTSIYQRGGKSENRALTAPMVRRLFSSSPKDPRYHMLSHLSAKFVQPAKVEGHEPRAALFLNRFTRTLTIMYATSGLADVIGIPAEAMRGRSFYYCIAESCLQDAVKCLENAKGNDSIAYLRFWFRDPRVDDPTRNETDDSDEEMTTDASEDGGVQVQSNAGTTPDSRDYESHDSNAAQSSSSMELDPPAEESGSTSRTSSGYGARPRDTHEAIFGQSLAADSSASSVEPSPPRDRSNSNRRQDGAIELEAVVSCTSDGLVVCLRKARPMIPRPAHRPSKPVYSKGLFAAPWAHEPLLPPISDRPGAGFNSAFAPSLGPLGARHDSASPQRVHGPDRNDFMAAIRDQAIFAWALTGINGALAEYGHGKPLVGALPHDGLPIWASDPHASPSVDNRERGSSNSSNTSNQAQNMSIDTNPSGRPFAHIFGDPGLARTTQGSSSTRSSNISPKGGSSTTPEAWRQ